MAPVTHLDLDLVEGTFGIREPRVELRTGQDGPFPDLVFVPGSCFDQRGGRIGQGMGFYDRYLTSVKALRAGLSYDVQIAEKNLALDPHDQFMDVLISEKRLMVFSASAGSAALRWNSAGT
jgi:5-formyltetrahydrofolate cyclo-ligase